MHYHLSLEPIKKMSPFERFVTVVVMIEPIIAIPQVFKIFTLQSATEFFIWRWVFGFSTAILMTIYGVKIKKAPLYIGSSMWMLVHGSMLIGILLYG